MANVVALALPGGAAFVRALQEVWESGDAAFVLDSRLPPSEAKRVLAAVAPGAVVEADGQRRSLHGGIPTARGDALIVPTSGTSGEPKSVVLTHQALAASAELTSSRLGVDPAEDVWLACLPLAHIGGLSVVTRALLTETQLVVHPQFDAADVMAAVDTDRVSRVSLVTRALNQVDHTRFATVLLGGAAPPPDRPANVIATYGSTETGSGVVYERQALDGVHLRIDDGGQLWIHSPTILRTYRSIDPNGELKEINPLDADGWYPSGDAGELDQNGVLKIHGKIGDVIVTGGEKVWPSRIEPLLMALESVADVAVVGRQDPDWGHVVIALVVPAEPSQPPTLQEVRAAAKAQLPAWYAPRVIELRESLPKTSLGKTRRQALESHEGIIGSGTSLLGSDPS